MKKISVGIFLGLALFATHMFAQPIAESQAKTDEIKQSIVYENKAVFLYPKDK